MPRGALPQEDTDLLFLMYAVLALTEGEKVGPAEVHDAWSAWMTHRDPSHGSIKPFAQLSPETKRQDQPFADAMRNVASQLR